MWTTLTAGTSVPVKWAMEAAHPGDCFAYISYDADKPDNQKKWFKVAQWDKCNMQNLQTMSFTLPSYLPSSEHAILRWEWYALHLRDINVIEFYAQCADVKIVGASNGQLPTPQVTIPGHIPMDAKFYRSDYKNPQVTLFTGPPIASIGGAAYNCESSYDNSCTVEPPTNNPCQVSHQRCMSSTTYQACGIGLTTSEWGAEQSCQTGLECFDHPDGIHIMCSWPRSATPTPTKTPTPSTPAPTATPTKTPAPSSTPSATPAPTSTPTSNPSSGGASCVVGHMRCAGDSTYESCSPKSATVNYWAAAQSCQAGLYCNPDGTVVRCLTTKPASSSTPAPTKTPAPTSAPTSAPTPATPAATPAPTTTVPSGVCSLGYQQCTGKDSYVTCGNGVKGPTWAQQQKCQTGLSCHQSTTANVIYCY